MLVYTFLDNRGILNRSKSSDGLLFLFIYLSVYLFSRDWYDAVGQTVRPEMETKSMCRPLRRRRTFKINYCRRARVTGVKNSEPVRQGPPLCTRFVLLIFYSTFFHQSAGPLFAPRTARGQYTVPGYTTRRLLRARYCTALRSQYRVDRSLIKTIGN